VVFSVAIPQMGAFSDALWGATVSESLISLIREELSGMKFAFWYRDRSQFREKIEPQFSLVIEHGINEAMKFFNLAISICKFSPLLKSKSVPLRKA
jgi:hypothetical protein